jgi:APA family basic amino acid/polyamine antiporter
VVTAILVGVLAGLVPLEQIAALANAGTLAAFVAVSLCMLVLRRRSPDAARVYRTPLAWVIGPAAIAGCGYLFWSLPERTRIFFVIWNVIGLAWYVFGVRGKAQAQVVA